MKIIYINSPKFGIKEVFVDDEDYDFLMKRSWHVDKQGNTFYAINSKYINGKVVNLAMHRLLMNAKKGEIVDHKFRNGLDNQKKHLRFCTIYQNQFNMQSHKDSSSKYLGVSFEKRRNKWVAVIVSNTKRKYLGEFANEIDAAKTYNEAAIKYHGEFANLNIIRIQ